MKLTVGMITARREPKFEWFIDSLLNQLGSSDKIEVLLIDLYQKQVEQQDYRAANGGFIHAERHPIKPSVWQGTHRLTKQDWWDISSSRNVIICLAKNPFVSFCDDRCVLAPTWLKAVRDAMEGNYAVSGSYSKHVGMEVERGVITNPGTVIGIDPRNPKGHLGEPQQTYGDGWYGCTSALPLDWALEMNGWEETCSGLGLEDVVFGNTLVMNNHITKYDPRMKLIEDRSPAACQNMPLRTDKDRHLEPRDKSHILLERCCGKKRTENPYDIRAVRNAVLAGKPFPHHGNVPDRDWYDGQLLSEMTVQ